jgi:hypothetical protein
MLNRTSVRLIAIFVLSFNSYILAAQVDQGFESGLSGWQVSENTKVIESTLSYTGKYCLALEGAGAEAFQRISVNPFSIVQFTAYLKAVNAGSNGYSFIRFYNSSDSLIIEFKSKPASTDSYNRIECYSLAPGKTNYLIYGVTQISEGGLYYADEINLKINPGETEIPNSPLFKTEQYLKPFWSSDTIFDETVLLLSTNGALPSGKLLFVPEQILTIKSFDRKNEYHEGIDITVKGNIISKKNGSFVPSVSDTSFSDKDLAWYDIQSKWIVVTYVHRDRWKGLVPAFKGQDMPNTIGKLTSGGPLKIVACGTSITRGMDVSRTLSCSSAMALVPLSSPLAGFTAPVLSTKTFICCK